MRLARVIVYDIVYSKQPDTVNGCIILDHISYYNIVYVNNLMRE